jgi:hypothetical protein
VFNAPFKNMTGITYNLVNIFIDFFTATFNNMLGIMYNR